MWGKSVMHNWLENQPALCGKRIWTDAKFAHFQERITSPIDIGGHKVPIVAITHPSNVTPRYDPNTWHQYLVKNFNNELSSLLD